MENVLNIVKQVNDLIEEKMWVDFCVSEIKQNRVKIEGAIDFSWDDKFVELIFEEADYVRIILYEWTKKENCPVLEILDRAKSKEQFGIVPLDDNDIIFKLNVDNGEPILIFAKKFCYKLL